MMREDAMLFDHIIVLEVIVESHIKQRMTVPLISSVLKQVLSTIVFFALMAIVL